MGHFKRGALILWALIACVTLRCQVLGADTGERPADAITFEQIQIFVQFENGITFGLMVDPEDSVRDLTYDISEHESVSSIMRLKLGNDSLTYAQQLSELNIQAGTTFTLVIPEHRDALTGKFTVRTRDGRQVRVQVSLGARVANLKDKIEQSTGIPRLEQRLLLRGRELRDERKLAQYETDDTIGSTILDLGEPLEDCRKREVTILVITPSGATIEINSVNLADTVADLKEKIRERTGAPASVQRLFAADANNNGQVITGEDHLCDLLRPVEANASVSMFFYSSRITSLDQVARLHEAVSVHRAPIFREAQDARERSPPASVYKDTRNWIARRVSRPRWTPGLFDPVARLDPNPDDVRTIKSKLQELKRFSLPNASELDRLQALIVRAQIKLSSAVRVHRVAANVSSQQPAGISLGGGRFSDPMLPLGADVNNWAPDALSDADVMRLFEVSERARRVLARDAQTGVGTLSIPSQGRINRAILMTYLQALAGYSPAVEHDQAAASGHEFCAICRDELTVEAAMRLPCEHALHADCILTWASKLYEAKQFPSCPICRQRFLFPYEALGKAELEGPELRGTDDEFGLNEEN